MAYELRFSGFSIVYFFISILSERFDHFLGLVYSFGEQDRPGTTLGAFEVVLTGPDTIRLIKAWQAFLKTLIAGVRQKAVGLGDGCRSQKG